MPDLRRFLKYPASPTLSWPKTIFAAIFAVACFQLAYSQKNPAFALFILGYAIFLVQLARQKTVRRAFYAGLAAGFFCVAPQLECFWEIFGPGAIALWLVLAFWIALFTATLQAAISRFGIWRAALLAPFLWTGFEYFRSEIYFLKFSWLNVGYAFSGFPVFPFKLLGVYGIGFIAFAVAAIFLACRTVISSAILAIVIVPGVFPMPNLSRPGKSAGFVVAGVQMEFPNEREIPMALDRLVAKYSDAKLLVLSEYTLNGPVPDSLKNWCRKNSRILVVGGKDPAGNNFFDTAFVVGTNGDIIFRQAKSVPIQFFKDGLPARRQELWNSPWGKIGICICYDLSYTRVTDPLVRKGAQMLIVPTMDVADWGKREHELHELVAPARAAEYGIPIFRLASSGISQAVGRSGAVFAKTSFPGEDEMLSWEFHLPEKGSVPLDRFAAKFSVVVTALLLLFFAGSNWLKRKRAVSTDNP